MNEKALIEELARALDMFLTHHVERDTLACDLTNDELTLMATGIADIIRRREIEAGEKVREAAAALMEGKGGVIPLASYYASFVSGNNMPHPSGDNRNRIKHEHQRRAFDRTTEDVTRVLRHLDVAAIIGGEHD